MRPRVRSYAESSTWPDHRGGCGCGSSRILPLRWPRIMCPLSSEIRNYHHAGPLQCVLPDISSLLWQTKSNVNGSGYCCNTLGAHVARTRAGVDRPAGCAERRRSACGALTALRAAPRGRRGGSPRGRTSGGRSPVRRPATVPQRGGVDGGDAPGEHRAVGPATSTASPASKSPCDAADAGRQQRDAALDQRPAGAVVDDDRAVGAAGEGDPQLARRQAPVVGRNTVPTPGIAGHGVGQHVGPAGPGDHGAHARPRGDLGRRQLRRHAAAAPVDAGAAGGDLERRGRRPPPRSIEPGVGVEAGVGGEQARRCRSAARAGRRPRGGTPARRCGRCRRSGSRRRRWRRSR